MINSNGSSTLTLSGSQVGVTYQLQTGGTPESPVGTPVGAAVAGTGGAISFPVGPLTATTNYNVLASGCIQIIDSRSVIVNTQSLIVDLNTCNGQPGENFFTNSDFGTTAPPNYTPSFQSYFPDVVFEAPLASTYTPNLTYGVDGNHTVNDNYYVIGNSTAGMFRNPTQADDVWILAQDPNSPGTGNIYIINANLVQGIFYVETLPTLCDSTKYEFRADIINLYNPNFTPNGTGSMSYFDDDPQGNPYSILPNIDFLIDGNVAFNTGNIMNDGSWHTVGFTFRTGHVTGPMTLTMRNNAPGGYGNDLALDNIIMRPCGPSIQLNITTDPPVVCPGTPVRMKGIITSSDYNSPVYLWQKSTDGGNTWNDLSGFTVYPDSTVYEEPNPVYGNQYRFITAETTVALSSPDCYVTSNVISIETIADILTTTGSTICGSGTAVLNATANTGSTINWYADLTGGTSLGTGTSFTTPSLTTTTTYYVDATQSGCTSSPRQAVVATVIPQPTITGTVPASRCGTGTVSLQATASEGTVYWYTVASGGTSIGSGSPWTTPSISATTTYYAEADNNGCTSASRTAVTAYISGGNLGTAGSITGPAYVCELSTGNNYSIPAVTNAANYNWTFPSGWSIESGQGTTSVAATAGSTSGTISVQVTGGCSESTTVTRAVTVLPEPSGPVVGTITQPTCETTTGSVALSGLPSSGTWTLIRNPGGVLTTGTGTDTIINNLSPGTYTFSVTDEDLTATCPGTGTGLYGEYYNNNMTLSGTPTLTRTDATVNFDWAGGSPDGSIGNDNFSVRWTGYVQPCYTETYTFYTQSDDGIRLWVDGNQIVNNWTDHGSVENSGTINLNAGEKYSIVLEFSTEP